MPLPPPHCPTLDCHDTLWKDTATTEVHWDNWRWWCRRCDKKWYPTREQIEQYRHGVGAGRLDPGCRPAPADAARPTRLPGRPTAPADRQADSCGHGTSVATGAP
ncbi:hypothetical protein O1L55_21955 [Streptomyces albulus]|nr:hypothetical protein [Streptomyces noursei]